MDTKDLQRYKQLLLANRDELLASGCAPFPSVVSARAPQGDYIDQANAEIEASVNIRMQQNNSRLLRAIDDALLRMSQGKFGTCEVCKSQISRARLEAVPWTRLCKECKEQDQSAA
jgi:DnaK suppressor protein